MLTDEIVAEIEAEVTGLPERRAGCVEALRIVQGHRRWVLDEDLRDIARLLEMTPEELDGIATFYPLVFRRPVGRHVVLVCDSIACWAMGYDALVEALKRELDIGLGETSDDGRFTLLPVSCIGECHHAPAIIIDEDVHRDVTVSGLKDILRRYV
jgi:NADH-quinone oxidoreductase subunit E